MHDGDTAAATHYCTPQIFFNFTTCILQKEDTLGFCSVGLDPHKEVFVNISGAVFVVSFLVTACWSRNVDPNPNQ